MDPRNSDKTFAVMYQLGQEAIPVNATIGMSMGQLVGAAEALRESKAERDNYISLFWARRDEAKDQIVEDMVKRFAPGYPVEHVPARRGDRIIEPLIGKHESYKLLDEKLMVINNPHDTNKLPDSKLEPLLTGFGE